MSAAAGRRIRRAGLVAIAIGATLSVVRADRQAPQSLLDHDNQQAQLAIEAAQRGPAVPYPLIGDNGRVFGVVYDQYLLGVVAARAIAAAGRAPDNAAVRRDPNWQSRGTIVVAYPVDCDGRPNRPLAIKWTTQISLPIAPTTTAGPLRGAEAQALLPGAGLPAEAIAVRISNAPMVSARVEIDYENPVCRGGARTESVPIAISPSGTLGRGFNGVKLPAAQAALPSPTTVRIRVTLDAAGRARFPELVQGPSELGAVAIGMLESQTFPPATVNGVPVPLGMLVPFVFTTTGEPGVLAPYAPSVTAGPIAGGVAGGIRTTTTTMTTMATAPVPAPPASAVPPAPAGQTTTQLTRLALEVAQRGDPIPIPLDAAGPAVHGVVYDPFLVGVLKARAAIAAGQPIDPTAVPASLLQPEIVAVAYPLSCEGATIAPVDIKLQAGGAQPGPLAEISQVLTGPALNARLPGAKVPNGAIGKAVRHVAFSVNLEARVSYATAPCGAKDTTLGFPLQWVRGQAMPHLSVAKLPAGSTLSSPTPVQLRGLVDLDGAYRFPTLADGPVELTAIAAVTASQWKFQPYRVNGVAVPQVVIMPLSFTTSGVPEPLPPSTSAAPQPPELNPGMPPVVTSSTRGGRSSMDFTTDSVAGLTAATSQCEIATDRGYGLKPDMAIGVGGGLSQGPAREAQYLRALRGPAGQGLHVVRLGAAIGSDGTILDLFQVTYPGLEKPIQIVLDEYHDGPLKAVSGLVCATRIK